MEIVPIAEVYWSEGCGDMIDTGCVIGYEARDTTGIVLGRGESVAEAIEDALKATWLQ